VAGLLAAELEPLAAQGLDHSAVADAHGHDLHADLAQRAVQAAVRHHRGHDAGVRHAPALGPIAREQRQDGVAVDERALLVDQDATVAIAVQGDAEIGRVQAHRLLQPAGVRRPAVLVDVVAVGGARDRHDLGAEAPEDARRDAAGAAVGAVDHDAQSVQLEPVGRAQEVREVGALQRRVEQRHRTPGDRRRVGAQPGLDLVLDLVGQLLRARTEDLDPVVLGRVVGGADHHRQVEALHASEEGQARRRDQAGAGHAIARGGQAARECRSHESVAPRRHRRGARWHHGAHDLGDRDA
jgi:hypothetical protein